MPKLTGHPHWPLTTYEKLWGFWHLAGKQLTVALGMIASTPLAILVIPHEWLISGPLFIFTVFPIFGIAMLCFGLMGVMDWWQVIHGIIPAPMPFVRIIAYAMNEPDPYKEQASLQAGLDEAKAQALIGEKGP